MKAKGILFVVSAPSGAGKTTLSKKVTEIVDNIHHSISHTARIPRHDEIDGRHYHFVSKAKFEEMILRVFIGRRDQRPPGRQLAVEPRRYRGQEEKKDL